MKPALSLVFFTVLSGAGLGLATLAAAFAPALTAGAFFAAAAGAAALVAAGLGASALHLANPKNAWRAFSRARTSWLSREAIMAALFFPLLAALAFARWQAGEAALAAAWFGALRAALAAAALLTVFCTAMIYQSLKPIAAWHHPLTSCNYLTLALMSGGVLLLLLAPQLTGAHYAALLFGALAAGGKAAAYKRLGAAQNIRVGRAAGYSQAAARLLDAGHTGPTFLTREFIYECAAVVLRRRRWLALALAFGGAALAVMAAARGWWWPGAAAALLMMGGLLLERWLFFAEARHSVRAYHGLE